MSDCTSACPSYTHLHPFVPTTRLIQSTEYHYPVDPQGRPFDVSECPYCVKLPSTRHAHDCPTWRERAERAEARVAEMEQSMLGHFQREHLAGDGQEIDRWKRQKATMEREHAALREVAEAAERVTEAGWRLSPGGIGAMEALRAALAAWRATT